MDDSRFNVHINMKSCILLVSAVLLQITTGAKVMFVPVDHPGHVNFHIVGGQALSSKGHEVYVFTLEKHKQKVLDAGLKPLTWKPKEAISVHDDPEFEKLLEKIAAEGDSISSMSQVTSFLSSRLNLQCKEFLSNADLMRQVADLKFDMALVDSIPIARCLHILPWMNHVKYISVMLGIEPWAARVPAMPSVEPAQLITSSNDMSFFERVKNFIVYIMLPVMSNFKNDESMLIKYARNRTERTFQEICAGSEMFLINNEILLLDYPRVSAPHYVFLGGMGGKPPKALTGDLEEFVSSADTLVVVCFGSLLKLTEEMVEKLLGVFSKHPSVHFVMRCQGKLTIKVPKNVKIFKWLPQNDLLGNPKTKLFITHGGNNGQLEGLYHGVPMIVAPGYADQQYNAVRLVKRKYGRMINIRGSAEEINSAILDVLENDMYRENIQKAAKIYRALPLANETLAFWVDHIIKYGSDHIRSPYASMPLYKFFMLDVLVFFCFVVVIIFALIFTCCKMICRRGTKTHAKQG